jgi:hypothetical protein
MKYTEENVMIVNFSSRNCYGSESTFSHFYARVECRTRFEHGELSSSRSYSGPDVCLSGQTDNDTPRWYAVRLSSTIESDYAERMEASYKLMKKWKKETESDTDVAVMFFKLCQLARVKSVIISGFNNGKEMSVVEGMSLFARETAAMLGAK